MREAQGLFQMQSALRVHPDGQQGDHDAVHKKSAGRSFSGQGSNWVELNNDNKKNCDTLFSCLYYSKIGRLK